MAVNTNQVIKTLADVFNFMKPFAGGSVPDENSEEYEEWLLWVQTRQEEFARRGFWRRLLTRVPITLLGETTLLPTKFHKHNGVYVLDVDGVDWADPDNTEGRTIYVELDNDEDSDDYGQWQLRFPEAVASTSAILWYFANPPKPTGATDILLLPGDLVGYGALIDYYHKANQEGSMDQAKEDAENRFAEYLSLEMIPPRYELLSFATRSSTRIDRLQIAKGYYYRTNRNTQ